MWTEKLTRRKACSYAIRWCRKYKTDQEAWDACHRADWMLWWIGKKAGPAWSDSRRPLVGCLAICASTAPTTNGHHEVARAWAIGAALRWSEHGDCSREELKTAAYAAADAVDAYAAYAPYAVDAYAAYAPYAVAAAAAYAADAADAAAYAAANASAADATVRLEKLAEMANIVREWYPEPPR